MAKDQITSRMYEDLRDSETRLLAERHAITARALVYIGAGLDQRSVLVALGISRATWYRRVQDLRQAEAGT